MENNIYNSIHSPHVVYDILHQHIPHWFWDRIFNELNPEMPHVSRIRGLIHHVW